MLSYINKTVSVIRSRKKKYRARSRGKVVHGETTRSAIISIVMFTFALTLAALEAEAYCQSRSPPSSSNSTFISTLAPFYLSSSLYSLFPAAKSIRTKKLRKDTRINHRQLTFSAINPEIKIINIKYFTIYHCGKSTDPPCGLIKYYF